ncbi:Methyltransf_11 domain-containing protein [Psidium guajava]|nr:Methyltransf_11 domain-containing protein [Psidium guajava]
MTMRIFHPPASSSSWPSVFNSKFDAPTFSAQTPIRTTSLLHHVVARSASPSVAENSGSEPKRALVGEGLRGGGFCRCGRRHFMEAAVSTTSPFIPIRPSNASNSSSDYAAILDKFHPRKPQWYEELQAVVLDKDMEAYEAEIAGYKSQLFSKLKGKVKEVLEIGIGTGPNLKYYANDNNVHVVGIDPNRTMERYSRAAAAAAGLPPPNFKFLQAVGEAVPLGDASVEAVVGTLVLCSVSDVDLTLKEVKRVLKPGGSFIFVEHVAAKDGTILKFLQRILDPLQQAVAGGCHLTRDTGKNISEAGFSSVELGTAFLANATLINSHIYGIANK